MIDTAQVWLRRLLSQACMQVCTNLVGHADMIMLSWRCRSSTHHVQLTVIEDCSQDFVDSAMPVGSLAQVSFQQPVQKHARHANSIEGRHAYTLQILFASATV